MIVVDAGHGGTDPGAVSGNIQEKDFNLKVANYIASRLKELGMSVVQTRTTDETVEPDERVRRTLAAFGDNPNVIVLVNHMNSGGGDIRCVR
jgi:N-acetylmuramoyl-L-alanine amidase